MALIGEVAVRWYFLRDKAHQVLYPMADVCGKGRGLSRWLVFIPTRFTWWTSIALRDLQYAEERHAGHLARQKYQHDFDDLRQKRHISLTVSGGGACRFERGALIEVFGYPSKKKNKTRQEPQGGQPSDAGSVT